MERIKGNLWDLHAAGAHIVVSTNIGHGPHPHYRNNMGAGIALQAMRRFPWLPEWYGKQCAVMREGTPVLVEPGARVVLFPVKPFNPRNPELGWAQDGNLDLIIDRLPQLKWLALAVPKLALSLVGAGPAGSGGGLDPQLVEHYIWEHLGDLPNVTLVEYEPRGGLVAARNG